MSSGLEWQVEVLTWNVRNLQCNSLSKHFLCSDDCECRPCKSTFLTACIRFLVTRANSRAKLFYRLVFLDQTEHFWPGDYLVSLFSKSIPQRNNISMVSRQVFCKTILRLCSLVAVTRRLRVHITSGPSGSPL